MDSKYFHLNLPRNSFERLESSEAKVPRVVASAANSRYIFDLDVRQVPPHLRYPGARIEATVVTPEGKSFRHFVEFWPAGPVALSMMDQSTAIKPNGVHEAKTNGNVQPKVEAKPKANGLENLQTPQQRKILDAVDQLRNCGLDKELSLPQLVVCGDQSAGKSSVLEALTEISFPRADNLCTRFSTEIILRRAAKEKLSISILPDKERSSAEFHRIKAFTDSISDFSTLTSELARIIESAKEVMGIGNASRTFAKDILRIEIQGPKRPQLTVVDLPGLIGNENQEGDKALVEELTKSYLKSHRTICLAVITALNDADNQRILTLVKEYDPEGIRSLGIITKPDRLEEGSGNEQYFVDLAANKHKKYFFKLGWHVLKNRKFEEANVSFKDRNRLEAEFFQSSNFKQLVRESLGIFALRIRLSNILLEHVKRELPAMRKEVDKMRSDTEKNLQNLGLSRASASECREYLMQLSEHMHLNSKSAVKGDYDTKFFLNAASVARSSSGSATRRLRALIQKKNEEFATNLRKRGYSLHIGPEARITDIPCWDSHIMEMDADEPVKISYAEALAWVNETIIDNRGRELAGNYHPLVISQLFWFQSKRWGPLAVDHISDIAQLCRDFTYDLLSSSCAPEVRDAIWTEQLEPALKKRETAGQDFLADMLSMHTDHPINHNHYYTDTIQKIRQKRNAQRLKATLEEATGSKNVKGFDGTFQSFTTTDLAQASAAFATEQQRDQLKFSCEEALDCMRSIYKVKQKVFIDNVVTMCIESRIVRDLENIFSPRLINSMKDEDVEALASEPDTTRRERLYYKEQLEKLMSGQQILKTVLK